MKFSFYIFIISKIKIFRCCFFQKYLPTMIDICNTEWCFWQACIIHSISMHCHKNINRHSKWWFLYKNSQLYVIAWICCLKLYFFIFKRIYFRIFFLSFIISKTHTDMFNAFKKYRVLIRNALKSSLGYMRITQVIAYTQTINAAIVFALPELFFMTSRFHVFIKVKK